MAWTLFSAELRCLGRRAGDAFAASPLVVGLLGLGVCASPAAALLLGVRARAALEVLAASVEFRVVVAVGALFAGATVGLAAPGRRALGAQLEAAPVRPRDVEAGLTVLPVAVLLGVFALPLALFVAPAARAGTPLVLGGVLLLVVAGAFAADRARILIERFRRTRSEVTLPARSWFAVDVQRHARRSAARRQVGAALVLSWAGLVALRATGVPADGAAQLAGATALLGAAIVPLGAGGVDAAGAWLWRASPRARGALAVRHVCAAALLGLATALAGLASVLALAWTATPTPPLAGLGVVVVSAGLLTGALVPWRADRIGEQLAAYALFALVVSALGVALARAASLTGAEHGRRAGALVVATLLASVASSAAVSGARR